MDNFFKLLDDLIRPGNWPFLAVFAFVLLCLALLLYLVIAAAIKQEGLNYSFKLRSLWIHLSGGPNDPKAQKRSYRKLLYVKVNYLANRKTQPQAFYDRTVGRLEGANRTVPVFDEAVYYTLKLFPEKRTLGPEQDQSSGVVDPRLVIPWLNQIDFHNSGARRVNELVNIEANADSDTMLSVSHFLNGLQGGGNQNFCTYADEDAESLRLVVDFSSIPHAGDFVHLERTQLLIKNQPQETDDLKYQDCGQSVYMAHCRNAKKGSLLQMDFTFRNWDAGATASHPQGPIEP